MKKIENLDTTSIERLAREFANPLTLTESIIARGIQAELATRPGYSRFYHPEDLGEELDQEGAAAKPSTLSDSELVARIHNAISDRIAA